MSLPLIAGIAAVCLSAAVAFIVGRLWFEWRVILVFVAIFYTAAAGIALYLARDASRRLYEFAQAESARASRIETELASARLAALQAQMHPHFLFNALNTVASLTQTDPRAAETTVEQLADVLRVALDRTDQPMSTVDDEIRFVRAYIGVESQRYGDRLSVKWQIDPSLNRAAVPSFSLQPLVENAIKHGLSGRAKGGRMIVSVQREPDDRIALAVDDDGDGFAANAPEGTGLSNLRRRLDALYGGAASLHVERRNPGARVVIRVPARLGSDTGLPCACS